jgi:hypothetical protein
LSQIEVARLSDTQLGELGAYGERWSRVRLSTAPADRKEAEEGVRAAYAAAGLAPPRQILWADGPYEMARQWARFKGKPGENVRHIVVDMVRRRAE